MADDFARLIFVNRAEGMIVLPVADLCPGSVYILWFKFPIYPRPYADWSMYQLLKKCKYKKMFIEDPSVVRDRVGHWHITPHLVELAVAIAKEMHFTDDRIKAVRIAAMLHDIGKIYVPAEFLSRPGMISENELNILRDHTEAGYGILKDIAFEYPVADIIVQHHERMNGSGYPHGLSGDQILLEARIIGVADVVESMGSHRPYRPSLGIERALGEIRENRGSLYDETVVDVCLKLFTQQGYRLDA